MEISIENMNELRASVSVLSATVNNMCNATDTEEIAKHFVSAKDLLIAIYKFNVERVRK